MTKTYFAPYHTPEDFSDLRLMSDGRFLTGLCFESSKDQGEHWLNDEEKPLPIFEETIVWLDLYFQGKDPGWLPKYKIEPCTPFQKEVIEQLLTVPFGQTITYGEMAKKLAEKHGILKMSARAVGGAVGWNPIGIIIPCHRVIGADGKLTGYRGGIKNKAALLKLEGELNNGF